MVSMLLLFGSTSPPLSIAATIFIAGTWGTEGTPGAIGTTELDGGDGGNGGDGESLDIRLEEPDENNSLIVSGGRGGSGGDGGYAPTPGLNGGDGGDGGDGGSVTATAITIGADRLEVQAVGGRGGDYGLRGSGSFPGVSGDSGKDGNGGDATAIGMMVPVSGRATTLNGSVKAFGGRVSDIPGQGASGGDARATIDGEATEDPGFGVVHRLTATAKGGDAGFDFGPEPIRGGNAIAEATGRTNHGTLQIFADAEGGRFDDRDGDILNESSGDATAMASGMHSGSGRLEVHAIAKPGGGYPSGMGQAMASGIATAGADVLVSAQVIGGSVDLRDAVSGSTSGSLTLMQEARAEISALDPGDSDATTSLTATNAGGGDLTVLVVAAGGMGNNLGGAGGQGRIELVDATGSQNVVVQGTATGGRAHQMSSGGPLGVGGTARIDSLVGTSTGGGDVTVEAIAEAAMNASVSIDNSVDGFTSGALALAQSVSTSCVAKSTCATATSPAGSGDASSRIERTKSAASFSLTSEAEGFTADSFGSATNSAGSVDVDIIARGVGGGGTSGLEGGLAVSTAIGRTLGDGQDVVVGSFSLTNAIGGEGVYDGATNLVGDGGDATSRSTGIAEGDSVVSVFDRAMGGQGGLLRFQNPSATNTGRGGDAESHAAASNAGVSSVSVNAKASGGRGGDASGEGQVSARGGDAVASGQGSSSGGADVVVRAEAFGGQGGYKGSPEAVAGRGGDASVTDLSGSTSGRLTLQGLSVGGTGGADSSSRFAKSIGPGGNAHVAIDGRNDGGGELVVEAEVRATAGGRVTLGPIRGSSSSGGDVSVSAMIDASDAIFGDDEPSGAVMNESISLINAISGETSGVLTLDQDILGKVTQTLHSELARAGSHEGLSLRSAAEGVGDAEIISRSIATNLAGWAFADASALRGTRSVAEAVATGGGDQETKATSSSSAYSSMTGGLSRSTAHADSSGAGLATADARSDARGQADGEATAFARNSGTSDVVSMASVTTSFGTGANRLTATAEGISTGGGDVLASAELLRRDAAGTISTTALHNAVSGSTAGQLKLRQSLLSQNGDVETSLLAENAGGGDLAVEVFATAQTAFDPFGPPTALGDVVLGDVIGRTDLDSNVSVDVVVSGRSIRRESRDEPSQQSRILGASDGGDVAVHADFTAIQLQEVIDTGSEIIGTAGTDVIMDSVVEGTTSGNLTLIQDATAGDGSSAAIPSASTASSATGGAGGEAASRLLRAGSFESLELHASASGGNGGALTAEQPGTSGRGGDAVVALEATNDAGGVSLSGLARAGSGGISPGQAARGGDARNDLRATTSDDGQEIEIGGRSSRGQILASAVGGRGGVPPRPSFGQPVSNPFAGDGGDAVSRSEGWAHGDSAVTVLDAAAGGSAGVSSSFGVPVATGGMGGDASSVAIAKTAGESLANAQAEAFGGGNGRVATGDGGHADARASAEGLGRVEAIAKSVGGSVSVIDAIAGNARSRAEAQGTSGLAVADASTGSGSQNRVRASVSRDVSGRTHVEAAATLAGNLPIQSLTGDAVGSAVLTSRPAAEDASRTASERAVVGDLLNERPGARIGALGQWQAVGKSPNENIQTTELDITLEATDSDGDLLLAIFEIESIGGGFEELAFRVEVDGQLFGDEQRFSDSKAAADFFATAIDLGFAFGGTSPGVIPAVRAIFEARVSENQSISYGIAAVVVPEPSAAVLIVAGLGGLAARRRGRRIETYSKANW